MLNAKSGVKFFDASMVEGSDRADFYYKDLPVDQTKLLLL
jgi:hypothetical protein